MLADPSYPSESVNLRTGSPWDELLSVRSEAHSPASPDDESAPQSLVTKSPRVVPKLVPEVEEVRSLAHSQSKRILKHSSLT